MRARWRRELDAQEREKKLTIDEAIVKVQDIGERMKELRDTMPQGSPDHAVAFQVASLIGVIEGALNIEKQKATSPAQTGLAARQPERISTPLVEA